MIVSFCRPRGSEKLTLKSRFGSADAKTARQWAKALKFLDPTLQLVSCGKEGYDSWDWIVLHELVDVVDYHSLHLYTKGSSHEMSVMGSAAAEKAIRMTMEVVDLARIAKRTSNRPKICFDEWSVDGQTSGCGGGSWY